MKSNIIAFKVRISTLISILAFKLLTI